MTLFGLFNVGKSSLLNHQRAMSAVGENLANINTPGYVRRRVVFQEGFGYRDGRLYFGTGVDIARIERVIDKVLDRRLSMERGEYSFWEALEKVATQVEATFNEHQDMGLSKVLNRFWNAWQELASQPESTTARDEVVERAKQLVGAFSEAKASLKNAVADGVERIKDWVNQVNTLAKEIAGLNLKLKEAEIGSQEANDLRDKLYYKLKKLSELTGARYYENGQGVEVFLDNGVALVEGSTYREIEFEPGDFLRKEAGILNGVPYSKQIEFKRDYMKLTVSGEDVTTVIKGKIGGTINGLVNFADDYMKKLDRLISEIAYRVNQEHVAGMGLTHLGSFTSLASVGDVNAPLRDAKGIFFADRLRSGAFEVRVWDAEGNLVETKMIEVDPSDAPVLIADKIDKMEHVEAYFTDDGRLVIKADAGLKLSFGKDTSGFLVSMGINTFFVGDSIDDIKVNPVIESNHRLVAAGSTPNAGDNSVALAVSGLVSQKFMDGDRTFGEYYDALVGEVGAKVARVKDVKDDTERFVNFLKDRWEEVSGVNLDEEFTTLIRYQRAYEAAARYITVVDEMINRVVNGMGVVGR